MPDPILTIDCAEWRVPHAEAAWIEALESGKVLWFPRLAFVPTSAEQRFLDPSVRDPKARNISLDAVGHVKGAAGDAEAQSALAAMIGRFRAQARSLIESLLPRYAEGMQLALTSYRPSDVATRAQSWRADDRRLHVDAFPSRPNRGVRILRVFTNVNPHGVPRVWRVGEPFEAIAHRFAMDAPRYSALQARVLRALHVTKSLRSEYDHLMLHLHDSMKADPQYQADSPQITFAFPPGTTWVCFSDQVSHAAMSGQYMLEQTFHLPAKYQYHPEASPLSILTRLVGRTLVPEPEQRSLPASR